jgi:hypothetical protein
MSISLARPFQLRCAHVRAIRDCLRGCNKNDVVGENELPVEGCQVEGLGPALNLGISPCHAPGSFIVVEGLIDVVVARITDVVRLYLRLISVRLPCPTSSYPA